MIDARLRHHLTTWLGQWPPAHPLDVVGSDRRVRPGWDGRVYPAIGVGEPSGAVLSVPPSRTAAVRELADLPLDRMLTALPGALGVPDRHAYRAVFRWTVKPATLADVGEWIAADTRVVPDWLRPFGGDVLIVRDPDNGAYIAGVGIKRHDAFGQELSVGTEPAARGRGLARRLVAQAARRVLDDGAVPTYQHAASNLASARVADAAGFADRGWASFGLTDAAD
jgi:GNAT superfamily N-acetyltransferase